MASTAIERERIYWFRKQLEYEKVKSWSKIYKSFPHIKKNEIRKIYTREKRKREEVEQPQPPTYTVEGEVVGEEELNEEELWERATTASRERKERNGRREVGELIFNRVPICIVWMADLHLGDTGVDYERLDKDLRTIIHTPGMYVALAGDLINNFIIGRLKDIRHYAEFSIPQEWVLARRVLRLLAPKLLLSVSGNHEQWTRTLSGVDFLKEVHARMNPDILYAKYSSQIGIRVGDRYFKARVRHKWKGWSQYNPTHGIEWAAKFDKGRHFDIGVAAHTHTSGLYRGFNNGGKTGHAILCGTYKVDDDFPDQLGLPEANESAAIAMIVDKHTVWGVNNLQSAADYLNAIYSSSSEGGST